ncbi:Aste57867_10416 [Aphanomyces stellatus]|uniref:Aste57867_10416 protein n=1 Tax=Aphanomyces stellatus TaxID=120398 RepID=A0A485KR90_9STRA|nr:hypothetical protein As57867_010376 [Aphanomyces stellatus]VFT87290.1 Aste57867_10416 [Aphanomyces stellatus]
MRRRLSSLATPSAGARCMTNMGLFLACFCLYVYYHVITTTLVWSNGSGTDLRFRGSSRALRHRRDVDGDLIHLGRLHAACVHAPDAGIPSSYNSSSVDPTFLVTPTMNETLLRQVLAQCPDVDVFMDRHDPDQCEDVVGYVKYLHGRALPRWVFEQTFHHQGRPWTYMDLCPDTALLFMHPRDWNADLPLASTKRILVAAHNDAMPADWQLAHATHVVATSPAANRRAIDWYSRRGDMHAAAVFLVDAAAAISIDPTAANTPTSVAARDFANLTVLHANVLDDVHANTAAVVACWRSRPDLPPLHLVHAAAYDEPLPANIMVHPAGAAADLLADASIVLWPTASSIPGRVLQHARAAGALVATTNGAPMNTLVDNTSGVLIEAGVDSAAAAAAFWSFFQGDSAAEHAAPHFAVTADGICSTMDWILAMPPRERARRAAAGHLRFVHGLTAFKRAMLGLRMKMLQDATLQLMVA